MHGLTPTLATQSGPAPAGLLSISPPVLFFLLGVLAALLRSHIVIPKPITKLLSLYLLWAIGFRGGVELAHSGLTSEAARAIGLALALAATTPIAAYFVLRRLTTRELAAAMAACYGSVSVVTFLTACASLDQSGIPFGGHMVAAMALMEAPAIVIALVLLRLDESRSATRDGSASVASAAGVSRPRWGVLLHEALLNGPVVLLLGSLGIGVLTGQRGYETFKPLCTDVFPGVLAFFLLDLGLIAARRLPQVLRASSALPVFALVAPVCFAGVALLLSRMLGVDRGDAVLLAVLAASSSYIAAPAALRLALPRADPALYVSMSLGVTFPFNILAGIPLYTAASARLWA